ncbi:MAG: amidase [Bacteroidetes bacterium]|nr:amidase [Bacteroidota bacterium]
MKRITGTLAFSALLIAISIISLTTWSCRQKPAEKPVMVFMTDSVKLTGEMFDLVFSQVELDSMRSGLNDQLSYYKEIHAVKLDNSIPPALLFNPLPAGFVLPKDQLPLDWQQKREVRLPDDKADLAFYSVADLSVLIKTRQITSVKLTKFFLDRLKKYGDTLKCVITLTEDLALKQAKKADDEIAAGMYRGPLHGIPFGLKDLVAVKGFKTTWGSVPYRDQVIDRTATVAKKLEAAGAVLVAKLTLGELAMDDVWFGGMTKNPWDLKQGSSGSSAGSASSVAAGLLPFAIGSETWGSIVSPSTRCGTTGLRPTFGRVSRAGCMALSWSMDKIGPIARSAEDCAMVFEAIRGSDGIDKTVIDAPFNYDPNLQIKNIRIGYFKNLFDKDEDHPQNDKRTLNEFKKLGASLVPLQFPDSLPVESLQIILSAEAAAAFDELTRSNRDSLMVRQYQEAWPNIFRYARFIPAVEYIQANRIRTLAIEEFNKLFDDVDVIISPSFTGDQLLLTNLTGNPCVVLPNGFDKDHHPTSITFIGKLFDEASILEVAKIYQDATDFNKQHPKMFLK